MKKIKKGDDVVIITGRDKGKRGNVLRLVSDSHVLVEGANKVKKHERPNPKKADRAGIKTIDGGKRVRYFKSNGEVIDV